jgi:Family of unknown function (DUF6518)
VTVGAGARRVGLIVAVGLATGVLSQVAQDVLPGEWSQVGNAISPWLLVAFLLGSRMPDARWAVAAGVVALLLAVVGFYATTTLRFGIGGGTSSLLFWGTGALVGGTVFGLAGYAWWTSPVHRRRALALGLLAAVFIGEALYHWLTLGEPTVGAAFAVVGAAIPAILGQSRDDRLGGYVAILPALALGALGYVMFMSLYGLLTGVG